MTRQQVNKCLMNIEDDHPLRRTAHIDDVWPCLKLLTRFKKKRQPDFRSVLKLCLFKEMDIRVGHDKDSDGNDDDEQEILIA